MTVAGKVGIDRNLPKAVAEAQNLLQGTEAAEVNVHNAAA